MWAARVAIASGVFVLGWGRAGALGAEQYRLRSERPAGETSQVEVLLDVGGDLSLMNEKEKRVQALKTSVVGSMVYDERLLGAGDASDCRGVRQYRRCDAVIKIDKGSTKPRLRDDRRLMAITAGNRQTTMFSPGGPLSREELDLIQIPACSLIIERLLPERPVSPGDQWQHSEDLLVALLNLDALSAADVTTTFKDATPAAAQLELAGRVKGAIDGVATEIELKGRYKFDLSQQRITWFALLVKEKRAIGHVAPGVDVTARLQMKISPASTCPELTDEGLSGIALDSQPDLTLLEYESAQGHYRFMHDRAWHVVGETAESVALRLIDRGELIAQCNVSALAPVEPGKRFTLSKFQEDVKRSLGDHFGQFMGAGESTNAAGQYTCRVIARGTVEQLPIQWNYYLVSDGRGRQAVVAFTLETDLVERFAACDESLLATVTFVDPPVDTARQPTLAPQRN
jgi:hypothetical protein